MFAGGLFAWFLRTPTGAAQRNTRKCPVCVWTGDRGVRTSPISRAHTTEERFRHHQALCGADCVAIGRRSRGGCLTPTTSGARLDASDVPHNQPADVVCGGSRISHQYIRCAPDNFRCQEHARAGKAWWIQKRQPLRWRTRRTTASSLYNRFPTRTSPRADVVWVKPNSQAFGRPDLTQHKNTSPPTNCLIPWLVSSDGCALLTDLGYNRC